MGKKDSACSVCGLKVQLQRNVGGRPFWGHIQPKGSKPFGGKGPHPVRVAS